MSKDWIKWEGGPCPVEPDRPVELKLRVPSSWDSGRYSNGRAAGRFDWNCVGSRSDIIAYRIVKP